MSPRPILIALVAALVSVSASVPIRAQLVEDYRFQGQVVDPHGTALAGVQIALTNTENGARIVFTTGPDGMFDQRFIPHAVYDVTVQKAGFVAHTDHFDWSVSAPDPIVKQSKIVLENAAERARKELGAKASKLYESAYGALAAGDCAKARQAANELLALGAGSYEYAVRFVLARCLAMTDSLAAATDEYRHVIALHPDLFEAHFDLAGVLERRGDHDAALQAFAATARLRPEDAEVEYNMGAVLFQGKKFDAARPHLERTLQLAPDHAQALKALGYVHLQSEKKDLKAASRLLRRYLEVAPAAPDAAQVRELVAALDKTNSPGK